MRMEATREAMGLMASAAQSREPYTPQVASAIAAALAEIEEWEDVRTGLENLVRHNLARAEAAEADSIVWRDLSDEYLVRAKAAEAEADRLKTELARRDAEFRHVKAEADRLKAALADALGERVIVQMDVLQARAEAAEAERDSMARALEVPRQYDVLVSDWKARAEAAEAERDFAVERGYAAQEKRVAAEAERDRLKEALNEILSHEMVQSHPYGARTIEVARVALEQPADGPSAWCTCAATFIPEESTPNHRVYRHLGHEPTNPICPVHGHNPKPAWEPT